MNLYIQNILRYIILMVLQVLLFNNLQFYGICTPFVIMLFLVYLPPTIPRYIELPLAFIVGLTVDIFCNTVGIHAAAATLVAFLRPTLLRVFTSDTERLIATPSIQSLGTLNFIKLIAILIVVYHLVVFLLMAFSGFKFYITILQILTSSLLTFIIALFIEFIKKYK